MALRFNGVFIIPEGVYPRARAAAHDRIIKNKKQYTDANFNREMKGTSSEILNQEKAKIEKWYDRATWAELVADKPITGPDYVLDGVGYDAKGFELIDEHVLINKHAHDNPDKPIDVYSIVIYSYPPMRWGLWHINHADAGKWPSSERFGDPKDTPDQRNCLYYPAAKLPGYDVLLEEIKIARSR